ncbi:uncharacterized protein BXZ73DRAFT_100018 [Epithele typhae]|uniref:uncharacterized protein n=1 Tax=Epithele typhae TaxID=378194 RepID=UPI0020080541|nr:uncharacterized protein BXZ73DRAFT_100018 [Epithele typhae]KAH9937803.1 hypothetical protein BXZ73DRAFT_100018 [Epithele typhae]
MTNLTLHATDRRLMPATQQEADEIETLNAMMGGTLDPAQALALLRKHGGNLEKAASALLEGDTGADADNMADAFADLPGLEPLDGPEVGPRTPPPSRPEKIIDLSRDDDDLTRALAASLEDSKGIQPSMEWSTTGTTFGPSNRAPDPNWAVVPSNVAVGQPQGGMSQDDQAMSRAIEASLSYNISEDTYFEPPLEERVREGDTPVALRPTLSAVAYAALLIHGLDGPPTGPAAQVYTLFEIFCNMDLARLKDLNVDDALNAFTTEPWSTPAERPVDVSGRLYGKVMYAVEQVLQYNNAHNPTRQHRRLVSLQHGYHDAPEDDPNTDNLSCVRVMVGGTPHTNDLVSSLATELAPPGSSRPRQVIYAPADVLAFQLHRDAAPPTYDAAIGRRTEREPFRYPKSVYLDQFMRESYALANEKREEQKRLLEEVKALEERKKNLLRFNDKDTLADLESALYYYQNVKAEAKELDINIDRARKEALSQLDCPELQHTATTSALSSCTTAVRPESPLLVPEETVLTDPTGLHLSAGPYFLLYSRALPAAEEDARTDWAQHMKDNVKHNNMTFFRQLPPDVAARVVDPNSPPASPFVVPASVRPSRAGSDRALSSDAEGPPGSEVMEIED